MNETGIKLWVITPKQTKNIQIEADILAGSYKSTILELYTLLKDIKPIQDIKWSIVHDVKTGLFRIISEREHTWTDDVFYVDTINEACKIDDFRINQSIGHFERKSTELAMYCIERVIPGMYEHINKYYPSIDPTFFEKLWENANITSVAGDIVLKWNYIVQRYSIWNDESFHVS